MMGGNGVFAKLLKVVVVKPRLSQRVTGVKEIRWRFDTRKSAELKGAAESIARDTYASPWSRPDRPRGNAYLKETTEVSGGRMRTEHWTFKGLFVLRLVIKIMLWKL